jgi:hypothetical protein
MTSPSVDNLKKTLRELLTDPTAEARFQCWMAEEMVNASDTPGAAEFLLSVQAAFADAANGRCTKAVLRARLNELAKDPSFVPNLITDNQSIPFSASGGYSPEFGANRVHVYAELVSIGS